MDLPLTFVEAIVVALGGSFVAGLIALVRGVFKMSRSIDKLVESDAQKGAILGKIAAIQQPQLHGIQTALEALKGECNGNVETAHGFIVTARADYEKFLADSLSGHI